MSNYPRVDKFIEDYLLEFWRDYPEMSLDEALSFVELKLKEK